MAKTKEKNEGVVPSSETSEEEEVQVNVITVFGLY